MPFGLMNAPAIFQRMMDKIFHDIKDISVVIYIDDILIFSKDWEQHVKDVREVLKQLEENNLFLKITKCKFFITMVTFVGIVITPEGISMEKDKIKAILEWRIPKTVKQVQAFLGSANFYQ
jgi:ribosome-interacting GTPase 1